MLKVFLTRVSNIICQVYPNICKKNALNLLAMSSLFVISVLFMLISLGETFLVAVS